MMDIKVERNDGQGTVNARIFPLNLRHRSINPLKNIPKSWHKIGSYSTSLNNAYNQSLMEVYQAKDGLRFSMYRDGCFYQYCGRIVYEVTNA